MMTITTDQELYVFLHEHEIILDKLRGQVGQYIPQHRQECQDAFNKVVEEFAQVLNQTASKELEERLETFFSSSKSLPEPWQTDAFLQYWISYHLPVKCSFHHDFKAFFNPKFIKA